MTLKHTTIDITVGAETMMEKKEEEKKKKKKKKKIEATGQTMIMFVFPQSIAEQYLSLSFSAFYIL